MSRGSRLQAAHEAAFQGKKRARLLLQRHLSKQTSGGSEGEAHSTPPCDECAKLAALSRSLEGFSRELSDREIIGRLFARPRRAGTRGRRFIFTLQL